MEILTCEICGKQFEYAKKRSCKAQLTIHLRTIHSMSLEDYIVKTQYNGIHPVCPCGCNRKLRFNGEKFNKYATDTCFGTMLKNSNQEVKEKLKPSLKQSFDLKEYYLRHYDYKSYKDAFELFSSKQFPLTDVAKQYNIDKRTLKMI